MMNWKVFAWLVGVALLVASEFTDFQIPSWIGWLAIGGFAIYLSKTVILGIADSIDTHRAAVLGELSEIKSKLADLESQIGDMTNDNRLHRTIFRD